MHLLVDILLNLCASSVLCEIYISTNNGSSELASNYELSMRNKGSIDFKIKACSEISIGLLNEMSNETSRYNVLFGINQNKYSQIRSMTSNFPHANISWSGLDCNCYIPLWVFWFNKTIKAGTDTSIGGTVFISWIDHWFDASIVDIQITSTSPAYWIFEPSANSTSACIPGSSYPTTTTKTTTTTLPTIISTTTDLSSTDIQCTCVCDDVSYISLTDPDLIKKIVQLRSELTVDIKKTNKYKRSLISINDNRPSSKCIGTIGVIVLVILFSIFVLLDFQHYAFFIFSNRNKIERLF